MVDAGLSCASLEASSRSMPFQVFHLAKIPMTIDVGTQKLGLRERTWDLNCGQPGVCPGCPVLELGAYLGKLKVRGSRLVFPSRKRSLLTCGLSDVMMR